MDEEVRRAVNRPTSKYLQEADSALEMVKDHVIFGLEPVTYLDQQALRAIARRAQDLVGWLERNPTQIVGG